MRVGGAWGCERMGCVCGVRPARMLRTEARSGVWVVLDDIL